MKQILILLTLFLLQAVLIAQPVEFTGKFSQGNLVIGKAENISAAYLNDRKLEVDESGLFAMGFDRDDTTSYYLKVQFNDNRAYVKKIKPAKSKYRIQRINKMKKKYVTPPTDAFDRIKNERKISRAAWKKVGDVKNALYKNGFMRPVEGGWISGVFGSQRILNGIPKNIHNGTDIAIFEGTPVHAMTDGVVVLAADDFYYSGNYIILDHGQGLSSFYLHLSKKDVKAGDVVKKGQKIGEVGTTGRSTGPHLHWGVQWYSNKVDPQQLLKMEF